MQKNLYLTNNLSVVVPTYNRAQFLDLFLEKHIHIFELYNISVFIYNNASTDSTKEVIDKWSKKYRLIVSKNNKGELLHPDGSLENALKLSNTKYRWLVGDTYYLSPELVKHINDLTSKDINVDAYVVNLNNIILDKPSKRYHDANKLLSSLGTIMACFGCVVYTENIILQDDFSKYNGTNYAQLGIVLEFINNKNFTIEWVQEHSVFPLSHPTINKKNWSHGKDVLKIAARNWNKFIFLLPKNYSLNSRLAAIKNFGKQTKIFTLSGLILMRMRGGLTYSSYLEYLTEIKLFIKRPVIVLVVSVIPRPLLKLLCIIYTKIFNKGKPKEWCSYE